MSLTQLATALAASAEETKAASDKHEREVLELITERDEAEESISQIYYIVTGNSPEWSNNFGYTHAQDDVADVVNVFKQAAKSAQEGLSASTAREKSWHDHILAASGGHASTPEGAAEVIRQLRGELDGVKEREKGLSLESLRSANQRRQKEWDQKDVIDLSYRGNELAGEVGEACNVIKKLERERLGIGGSRDTIEHLAEELADVIICADLIGMKIGIDLGAAVVAKFNKTSESNRLGTRLAAALATGSEAGK